MGQALRTAEELAPIGRKFTSSISFGLKPSVNVPLFVAGYTGWNTVETVQQRLAAAPGVAGILVIDPRIFVGAGPFDGTVIRGLGHCGGSSSGYTI
jgi:hypothetical protein